MTIRVALEHRTSYRFSEPVQVYPHTIRLRPAPHARTPVPSYSLRIEPENHFVNWQQDPFGNWLARVVFPDKVDHLEVTVDLLADMTVINPFDFFVEDWAATFPFAYPEQLRGDLAPYLHPVGDEGGRGGAATSPDVVAWLEERMPSLLTAPRDAAVGAGTPIVGFLVGLNRAIRESVDYTVRLEAGVQTPAHTLDRGIGSCRDSAWLLVAALRHLGLAARFVSGYLVQLSTDQAAVDGPSGPAEDFTDLHAWAEVYVPGAGWVGLDATSGLLCGEGHIPLSCTPHPSSAAPISGATGPVGVDFDFANTVTRLAEDPRVTKPVDEEQWSRITAVGEAVDGLLAKGDVRLTMGGEPTFVAAGGTTDPQWHTAADGEQKRGLAMALARRLSSPGTLRHHGQGKWYPGEPLPRWQIMLADRTDGQPLWSDPDLLDDPWGEARLESGSPEAVGAARDLAVAISRRLGIDVAHLAPAVEDPLQRLVTEARLPAGEGPTAGDLPPDSPELADERARAAHVAGVDEAVDADTPAAWVLPVFPAPDGEGWATTTWRTRRGFLALVPGDSPAGLRLPLGSIAWGEGPITPQRSPFAPRGALPAAVPPSQEPKQLQGEGAFNSQEPKQLQGEGAASTQEPRQLRAPAQVIPIEEAPRTALAVEHRDGHLFVFLPPLEDLEDAVGLIAAVEGAATELGQPVVLEGYPPPGDERVRTMSITPDPGVIEVNVSPTSSWTELVEQTESVHEHARQIHLASEKFDVDGSHTGTGGGNHLTLGGRTPADSPLLRRPDLLRSLVTYWQHHPALSYLFSGRFVGPTSQAPRVDEGRSDTLYELEIAFAQMDHVLAMEHDAQDITEPLTGDHYVKRHTRPWLVDRLLRHLLTDITGNTHRAEFCIDKLFAPGSERGRLGLLEMRGFEMPPHPRMALLQALLVRSLVAKFWDEPYSAPLVHWGTRLHDRYLLPAFVAADLRDVIDDVNRYLGSQGVGQLDPAWFDSFLEFRFPRLGDTVVGGVELGLRSAIEPWHVLGDEVSQSGTARYVDSSVEKVQVRAVGLVEGRHVVTCNGVPVPMVPVAEQGWGGPVGAKGSTGAFVGGVRFRAWAPPSALHPTIGVHGPLVFDLVDRWSGRSLGGFTHHVTHPGGISYSSFPVNAAAAESRRAARFVVGGHTPGPVDVAALPDPLASLGPAVTDFPVTLDLRRFPGTDRAPGTVDDFAAPPAGAVAAGMPPAAGADVVETSAEGPVPPTA
ncbi:transglutaminase family protein [Janibacter cremeus]|uniref:transglutaminase family protein n=1 Tax=Janibacter cremeus TaxID=1285192 RepID=UPI0023F69FAF|nr:transglutaminase family protein [Janibacter cremeus]WEV77563.1 transglutaminase family protein [Janibacter cremeus]